MVFLCQFVVSNFDLLSISFVLLDSQDIIVIILLIVDHLATHLAKISSALVEHQGDFCG